MKNFDHDKIFSEMKKCFRNVGLCVIYEHPTGGNKQYEFRSLVPGLSESDIYAWYEPNDGYAALRMSFGEVLEFKDIDETNRMVNESNQNSPLFHYLICPDCGAVEMVSGIHVTGLFPIEKFERLLKIICDELKLSVPAMVKIISDSPELQ